MMKWRGVCSNSKKYKYYKFLKEKYTTNVKTRRGPYLDPAIHACDNSQTFCESWPSSLIAKIVFHQLSSVFLCSMNWDKNDNAQGQSALHQAYFLLFAQINARLLYVQRFVFFVKAKAKHN
jgi:hypothetical protein